MAVLALGGRDLLAGVLRADRADEAGVVPELVVLIGVTAGMGFLSAIGPAL